MELLQVSVHGRVGVERVHPLLDRICSPDDFLDQDTADKVTDEWKVIYKECSAKNSEAVTDIFKTTMLFIEKAGVGRKGRGRDHDDDDDGTHLRKCVIL